MPLGRHQSGKNFAHLPVPANPEKVVLAKEVARKFQITEIISKLDSVDFCCTDLPVRKAPQPMQETVRQRLALSQERKGSGVCVFWRQRSGFSRTSPGRRRLNTA
jgi:hypothetical protein